MPRDRGVSQEKNISPFHVCFSDQGSTGRHTDRTERRFLAAKLARGQGVHISFQAWTNYWFKLWSPALSSLILKSVTPSHKTIRALRGLAKGASRKWSQVAGIAGRMERDTRIVNPEYLSWYCCFRAFQIWKWTFLKISRIWLFKRSLVRCAGRSVRGRNQSTINSDQEKLVINNISMRGWPQGEPSHLIKSHINDLQSSSLILWDLRHPGLIFVREVEGRVNEASGDLLFSFGWRH